VKYITPTLFAIGALFISVPIATAQDIRAIVLENAPIHLYPDAKTTPLRTAAVNTSLVVIEDAGEWLRVEFEDPVFGSRQGYVQKIRVRVNRPELKPMDLSVPSTVASANDASKQRVSQGSRSSQPSLPARIQDVPKLPPVSAGARVTEKGWLDVSFGVAASGADTTTFTYVGIKSSEPYAMAASYPKPSRGAEFDFGGGYMFNPVVGLGINFTGTAHEDAVGLGATIPHPYYFNAAATAANVTAQTLSRTEGGANIQVMVVAANRPSVRFRVFGGPTFFRYQADMIRNLEYAQVAPIFSRANVIEITGFDAVKTEGTGWGFHAGADVSFFFSHVVGVGGFARYSRGTLAIDEPMSESQQDVTVGGFQTGGGLRLRF